MTFWKKLFGVKESPKAPPPEARNQPSIAARFHGAVQSCDLQTVKALLADNPDLVSSKDGKSGYKPLHKCGWTALHTAAANGYKDIVELLLAHKAEVNARDQLGQTPLHVSALRLGNECVVELLLASHADINARDTDRWTPLHTAAYGGVAKVAEMLLARRAKVNARDRERKTALHLAAQIDFKEVPELLLANKADVNAEDNDGATPMEVAAAKGNALVVDLLRHHRGHE